MRMFTGTFDAGDARVNYSIVFEYGEKSVEARVIVAEKDGTVLDEFSRNIVKDDPQHMRRKMVRKAKGRSRIYY